MKKTKNIDKLFQEKFQDFEATPNEKIWNNIEFELKEKEEKRRIIPFWWKLSGVAALIAVGFFLGKEYTGNNKLQIPNDHNERSRSTNNEVVTKSTISKDQITIENTVVVASEKVKNNQISTVKNKNLVNENKTQNAENKAVVSTTSISKSIKNKKQKTASFINNSKENAVVSTKDKSKNSQNSSENNNLNLNENKNAVTTNSQDKTTQFLEKNKSNTTINSDNKLKNNSDIETKYSSVDERKKIANNQISNTVSDENKLLNYENINTLEAVTTIPDTKKEEIASSLAKSTNELSEFLTEKEKKKKIPTKTNRWQISTVVAPIVFGSTSNDSPVDAKFNGNSKTYENSMSYGVGLQYNLTKKITIRTGINKLALDYATNDVAFLENTQTVESLAVVSSENNIQFVSGNEINTVDSFTLASNSVNKGTIRQEFGYLEIPFELSYAIIDKKIKVNVITGLSSLFLDQNNISLSSEKQNVSIGDANNLNKVNFSTNVGLGINYNLYKTFYLNLDSILKYQLNTFSSNSGNFNPYIIGLYSGISYKF